MSMLADHYDESGGNWLPEGEHNVMVSGCTPKKFNSGNVGVEFALYDNRRRQSKIMFVLTENSLWRLAKFAKACGFSREDLINYDPQVFSNHQRFIGRRVMVDIAKGEVQSNGKQYNEVRDFWPVEGGGESSESGNTQQTVAPVQEELEDDIPF